MSAPLVLLGFCLWDYIERQISRRNADSYRSFRVPTPEERLYDASDVSLVVPTIDADMDFAGFLCRWLSNRPREVILVTLESEEAVLRRVIESQEVQSAKKETRIELLTVKHANKRDQLCVGINASTGKIIALVDDDAYYKSDEIPLHLLAPFQEDDVGLVGGPIGSYVPADRQHGHIITPWEVAGLRIRQKRGRSMAGAFAADGGTNFTVSGLTMLLYGEILRDSAFQHAFTNDLWMGQRQNSSDDAFITRWVLYHHLVPRTYGSLGPTPKKWRLGIQLVPEAEISTSLMRDSRFAGQMKRWWRSGLRHRLTCLFNDPGFLRMYRTTPYMARKVGEGLINPILTIIRCIMWWKTLFAFPFIAIMILLLDLYLWGSDLAAFIEKYPWCRAKVWAAIIADRLYLISDWYCWITLSQESWLTRPSVKDGNVVNS